MKHRIEIFGTTDIGRERQNNEDQFVVAGVGKSVEVYQSSLPLEHTQVNEAAAGKLLVVADGMGGHADGERASQLAVEGVIDFLREPLTNALCFPATSNRKNDDPLAHQLSGALTHCQKFLQKEAAASPSSARMGSTLTMAYILWPKLYLVHAGDSRCYLNRDGHTHQLTNDHTLAALYKSDSLESDECLPAPEGALENVLWNAVTTSGQVRADVSVIDLAIGDSLILCTDGLTKHVSRKRIGDVVSTVGCLDQACRRLVKEANRAGGRDNITLVACRFVNSSTHSLAQEAALFPRHGATNCVVAAISEFANQP